MIEEIKRYIDELTVLSSIRGMMDVNMMLANKILTGIQDALASMMSSRGIKTIRLCELDEPSADALPLVKCYDGGCPIEEFRLSEQGKMLVGLSLVDFDYHTEFIPITEMDVRDMSGILHFFENVINSYDNEEYTKDKDGVLKKAE